MNQAIEQAIIDHTNKVWEQALKVGIADEQERIIKLLEESQIHWRCGEGCCDCLGWNGDEPINQLGYLIRLIKGETN
jgi:hypothetical protein